MRILFCHERFLFRFGADRFMMLIAEGLAARGHEIVFLTNRCDEKVLQRFASKVIFSPSDQSAYIDLSEYSAKWLEENWDSLFADGAPDIVLHGGWPYFSAMPLMAKRTKGVVFMECGVVPGDGLPDGTQTVLNKLKELRRENLSSCSAIAPISDFLAYSQSFPDSSYEVPIRTIRCGADHMDGKLWTQDLVGGDNARENLERVAQLKRAGRKVILALGRWEATGYKNSGAAFDVLRHVRQEGIDAALLILANPPEVEVPPDLAASTVFLHFPDDRELQEIMKLTDLGISMSFWEGFNLPLAEMQWLGKGALVLDVGAHSEVVADPWFLCANVADMSSKAAAALRSARHPQRHLLARFRERFLWDAAVEQYQALIDELAPAHTPTTDGAERPFLLMDVSNSTRDPANSGVIRVTRRLARTLQEFVDLVFVVWDADRGAYVLPTPEEAQQLGQFHGPTLTSPERVSPSYNERVTWETVLPAGRQPQWLLCTETMNEEQFSRIRGYAKQHGFRTAAIFYDAIPVLKPELCSVQVRENHGHYMRGLAECDAIFPISHWSAESIRSLWKEWGVVPTEIFARPLPGEFGGAQRTRSARPNTAGPVKLLCVSTIEPRKNHRTLIAAAKLLERDHPELDFQLTMVGNRYAGAMELSEWLEGVCLEDSRLKWTGIVSDDELIRLYEDCHFTIYPSVMEGYGLPIIESIWHGRPCICSQDGVMAELAADGGCLTVDVEDAENMAQAMYRLATDSSLRQTLADQATKRPILAWREYAASILESLRVETPPTALPRKRLLDLRSKTMDPKTWQDIFYPDCIQDGWQMENSERAALTALLARHQPKCSIEIGTFRGGSLSLISQVSEKVYSLDIDPDVAKKLGHLRNVTFITGDSGVTLPKLLGDLSREGPPVDFILLDGDHTAGGVRRDLNSILAYRPQAPMFLMMHDAFNPGCRQGMIDADWKSSPYCHWVDIDFVPGRRIEHGGGGSGEMWGGLGAAYFHPTKRQGDLTVRRSAQEMFELLRQISYGDLAAKATH